MCENVDIAQDRPTFKQHVGRHKTRISLTPPRRGSIRRSLNGQSLLRPDDSPMSVCSNDAEWEEIQDQLRAVSEMGSDLNRELEDGDDCVRAITFDGHRPSLGSIAKQREEVDVLKRSLELDEEAAFIDDYIASMEENFALTMAHLTMRRVNHIHGTHIELDVYELLNCLNLPDHPYTEWGQMIEQAVTTTMIMNI